jgi:drug/metabolite transporter (DMT)-like permease
MVRPAIARFSWVADAGTAAPLQYTLLPWAMLLGWLAFGDVPRPVMVLAAGAIVLAGVVLAMPHRGRA